jgi:hypothetical protein
MTTYKNTSRGITKDGHTMLADDIAKELNRKSHLEALIKPETGEQQLIDALTTTLNKRSPSRATLDGYTAKYLIEAGYRKTA